MAVPTTLWRGVSVSRDMIDPLNSLAKSVGPLVTPIPGYGSYRDNDASGGTDNGSGHLDCYAGDGWTDADRERFVRNARQRGFMAFYRPKTWYSAARKRWISATWARHFHLILKDTADPSPGAEAQLTQWYRGSNGLAGFTAYGEWMYDPDPHDRTFLYQTWREFVAKGGTELGNTVTKPDPAPTVPEEDDMATPQEFVDELMKRTFPGASNARFDDMFVATWRSSRDAADFDAAELEQLASAVVAKLGKPGVNITAADVARELIRQLQPGA